MTPFPPSFLPVCKQAGCKIKKFMLKCKLGPGVVAHASNPSTLGGGGGRTTRSVQEQLGQDGNPVSTKNAKKLAGSGSGCL